MSGVRPPALPALATEREFATRARRPSARLARGFAIGALLLVGALSAAPSAVAAAETPPPGTDPPVAGAQSAYDAADQHLHDATRHYSDRLSVYLALGRDLKAATARKVALGAKITGNARARTSAETARRAVTGRVRARAADLYKRGASGGIEQLGAVLDARTPVEAARVLHLGNAVATTEIDAQRQLVARLQRLASEARTLDGDEAAASADVTDLTARRTVLHHELETLDAAVRAAEQQLADATNALRYAQWELWVAIATADGSELPGGIPPPPEIVNAPNYPRVIPEGDGQCPIAGPLNFRDDFGDPRSGGRTHKGQDLFNGRGTPNVAVADGTIIQQSGGLGGLAVWLTADNGDRYYYAHLEGFEGPPRRVKLGEIIAYTGDTGNALGGATHTHFEVHPGGGPAIDPYPLLRAWCGDAAAGIVPPAVPAR